MRVVAGTVLRFESPPHFSTVTTACHLLQKLVWGSVQVRLVLGRLSAPFVKDNVAASLLPCKTPSGLLSACVSGDGNCLFHAVKVALDATSKCLQVPDIGDLQRNCSDELQEKGGIYAGLIVRHAVSVQSCLSNAALAAYNSWPCIVSRSLL